jgi:hypothetical protein
LARSESGLCAALPGLPAAHPLHHLERVFTVLVGTLLDVPVVIIRFELT